MSGQSMVAEAALGKDFGTLAAAGGAAVGAVGAWEAGPFVGTSNMLLKVGVGLEDFGTM